MNVFKTAAVITVCAALALMIPFCAKGAELPVVKAYTIHFADGQDHEITVALNAVQRDELKNQGTDFGISVPAFSDELHPNVVFLGTKQSMCAAKEVYLWVFLDEGRDTIIGKLSGENTPTVEPLFADLCEAGKRLAGGV